MANSELQILIRIQQLDLKIVELQERNEQIPQKIQTFKQRLEASRRTVEESVTSAKERDKERRGLEGEVDSLREKLSRYQTQLMEVKTNKEYQAMLHEIDSVEQEIVGREDKILEAMVAVDEWKEKLRRARLQLDEEEKEVSGKTSELEAFTARAEGEIDKLREEKSQLLGEIPSGLIQQYERIASARYGVALAEAKDQSCQACHVKLRPQLFNDLKTNQFIITCESCNRILYHAGT